MVLSLFSINPITLLVFVAIVNGVAAAPFLAVTMIVASDRAIMGEYVNGKLASTMGWLTVIFDGAAAALALLIVG